MSVYLTKLDTFSVHRLPEEQFSSFFPELSPDAAGDLAALKNYVATCDRHLSGVILEPHAAKDVHRLRSHMIDRLVLSLFKKYVVDLRGVSLVAVGGYGREEMSLFSDIDLLFLHDGTRLADLKPQIENLLYALWDLKLDIGQAVRTPNECLKLLTEDHTIFTNLLDARLIHGDGALFQSLQNGISTTLTDTAARRRFIDDKIRERAERHAKFGGSVFLLEPNLKEGKGGLRDLHMLRWLARAEGAAPSFRGLAEADLVSEEEAKALDFSLRFLLQVRNRLHLAVGRKTDQINFDNQEKMATSLGFTDSQSGILAVERFMQAYYTIASQTMSIGHTVIRKIQSREQGLIAGFVNRLSAKNLDEHFKLVDGQIVVKDPTIFDTDSKQLMVLFKHVRDTGAEIHFATKEAVGKHLYRVNDAFRSDPHVTALFREMMSQPPYIGRALFAMHELHFFDAFIPEFRKLRNRVQHDVYHVYTVDTHSIFALRELSRLARGEYQDKFPSYAAALTSVRDKGVLAMGLLFHDVGKGEGGNHSVVGAAIARRVAERLGYSPEQIDTIDFLVLSHLMMPHLSQRRDLEDQHLIGEFAKTIQSKDRLDMLYVLTWGDIRAVSPESWTEWKGSLLERLYTKTKTILEEGHLSDDNARRRIADARAAILARSLGKVPVEQLEKFLTLVSPRYVLAHSDDEIFTHFNMLFEHDGEDFVFKERELSDEGISEITAYAFNNPRVLSLLTGVMLANGVNILSLEAFTFSHGFLLVKLRVQTEAGNTLSQAGITERIASNLRDVFTGKSRVDELIAKRKRPTYLDTQKTPTQKRTAAKVDIDNDVSPYFTIIDIYAHDRLGLLYDIVKCLGGQGCYVEVSKISTKVEQVVDSFYVKDIFGHKITSKDKLAEIKKALRAIIEPDEIPATQSSGGI